MNYRIRISANDYNEFWDYLESLMPDDATIEMLDEWLVKTIPLISESTMFAQVWQNSYIGFKTEEDMTMFMLEWK